ncbi:hypothetical protein [Bacillus litorisediminis]|uniref:hypothetical protein n=1 Tax=Bacillus litorisediminis TaxID=2922713 RepID=UPI001FAE2093|nr:hypothetical protein [Bacillus litorisediminis]
MKLLLILLFVLLIGATSGVHLYYVWKKKDIKTLIVQASIIGVAIIGGIFVICDLNDPSISNLLNNLSPLEK